MNLHGPARLAFALAIASSLAMGVARADDDDDDAAQAPVIPAYHDRIIPSQQLQRLPADDEEDAQVNTKGLPRTFSAEAFVSRTEIGKQNLDEEGFSIGGHWETPSWGSFSLDAALFNTSCGSSNGVGAFNHNTCGVGGSATLWQRSLYMPGGWVVNNGLGVLNTPAPPLQRNQYRFFLPTVTFVGASSEWQQDGHLLLEGSIGRAGIYSGTHVRGFEIADGNVASLSAQWSWAPHWTGAASFLGTNGRIVPNDLGQNVFQQGNTQAIYAATAWQGARDNVQLNVVNSNGDLGNATGAWIDASAIRGRYTSNYGAYRLDPGLAWGALPINNDVKGGYYHLGYQYGSWNWHLGIDGLHSLSGHGFDGFYGTSYVRYQATSTLGYGGSLGVRDPTNGTTSYTAQAFLDKRTPLGQTRLQIDQAGGNGDSWQVSVDQAFPLQPGKRLSTSLAYGSLRSDNDLGTTRTASLALYGGVDLTDRLSVDGSARWTHGNGNAATRGTNVNLSVNWRVNPSWSMNAAIYENQGSQRSPFILDPLVTQLPFVSLPRDRSIFLTLRYERSAGQPQGVIGGKPGGPTGTITGSVFLDDNSDGVRNASELPAANVTVLLDNHYSVHTDSMGNFEFPRVATGTHTLSVVPDNLPLPWFFDDGSNQRSVMVTVRQLERVDFGAQRKH